MRINALYYGQMVTGLRSQASWAVCLICIIALGILSRTVHTGFVIFDKYLGDALYAAMVYSLLRLSFSTAAVVVPAMVIMTAIELFQLTMIPARLVESGHFIVRIGARLLGTQFSLFDLLAYGVGIGCIYLADSSRA